MALRLARVAALALVLTTAVVTVSAEDDDVDRTDFSDPALTEDKVFVAKEAHSEIEINWILPEAQDGKIPIGGTTDLLAVLVNGGSKMFNVSRIEGQLLQDGNVMIALDAFEFGQSLGPRDQRGFRFPIVLSEDEKLGSYTLLTKAYYNTRDKMPFVSLVTEEPVELVPALPKPLPMEVIQMGIGAVLVVAIAAMAMRSSGGGAKKEGKKAKDAASKADARPAEVASNEWLSGTLAGTENGTPKKVGSKKKK